MCSPSPPPVFPLISSFRLSLSSEEKEKQREREDFLPLSFLQRWSSLPVLHRGGFHRRVFFYTVFALERVGRSILGESISVVDGAVSYGVLRSLTDIIIVRKEGGGGGGGR